MFSKRTVPIASESEPKWKVLSEITNLHTDLLSARCTVDRLRFRRGSTVITECLDRKKLDEIRSNLTAIQAFLDSVDKLLGQQDPARPKGPVSQ